MTALVPTLHILNKGPGHPRIAACLNALSEHDRLLLIENGVLSIAYHTTELPWGTVVLAPDAHARGLNTEALPDRITGIDFADMVKLTDAYERIISW